VKRPHPAFDSLVHDSRRDAWIAVLPARDFIVEPGPGDRRPSEGGRYRLVSPRPRSERELSLSERAIPWIMLAWSCLVWTFLFYDLGHL
jgi:hypothetical protein